MILEHPALLRHTLLAAALACAAALPAMAADMVNFSATLSGTAEVPPNASAATGSLEASLDKDTRLLRWTLKYSGLSGPATAAHFHGPAMPGENTGVAVPFPSAASAAEGQATLTPEQLADLVAGKWYANVHTAAHPGGEIRGQLMMK